MTQLPTGYIFGNASCAMTKLYRLTAKDTAPCSIKGAAGNGIGWHECRRIQLPIPIRQLALAQPSVRTRLILGSGIDQSVLLGQRILCRS